MFGANMKRQRSLAVMHFEERECFTRQYAKEKGYNSFIAKDK
jgi:hypothetical protein